MTAAAIVANRGRGASDASASSRHVRLLYVLFFFSGFPALIYQLVWQRALFRIFGVNIESVTIVVTAFMLGLGIGGLAGGWLSTRRPVPLLVLLACIEALTAIFGEFSLALFERVGDWILGAPMPVMALATLALVLVPTLLMGATLPLLVGHLVQRSVHVGTAVGLLYHANTLGAAAACLACAIVLFPTLGMQGSVQCAIALNVLVALGAASAYLLAHRGGDQAFETVKADAQANASASASTLLPFSVVLVMAGAGGLVSLSYEIFFFRAVSYASGGSPFAFATRLGAFLVGLASGARVGGEACAAGNDAALIRRLLQAVLGATAAGFAFLPLLSHLAWLNSGVLGGGLLVVYVLARQWGLVLPCLAHLGVSGDARAGWRTGVLYLCNICGAAVGSVLTGFVLTDRLGLVQIGQVLVAAGFACALVLALVMKGSPQVVRRRLGGLALTGVAAVAALPVASGRVLEALQAHASSGVPAFARILESRSGIVTVDANGTVFGNGAYDGHFNVDLVNDVNGIVRPYALSLFHGAPRDVLMIGVASGSWAQVLANNPEVRSLTVVEINPSYMSLIAGDSSVASVLTHPKVTFVVDDGRRWLRLHEGRRFDAIVANTTFHYRANSTNLLSSDFLTTLKSHLNAGGIVFYNTTDSSRVQRTGCATFLHGARFTNHVILSDSPIDWDFERWHRVLAGYLIDGRPVLDLSVAAQAEGLGRLMSLQPQTRDELPHIPADSIEPCSLVLARTTGQELVTDDNMGTEWRAWRGSQ